MFSQKVRTQNIVDAGDELLVELGEGVKIVVLEGLLEPLQVGEIARRQPVCPLHLPGPAQQTNTQRRETERSWVCGFNNTTRTTRHDTTRTRHAHDTHTTRTRHTVGEGGRAPIHGEHVLDEFVLLCLAAPQRRHLFLDVPDQIGMHLHQPSSAHAHPNRRHDTHGKVVR